MKEDAACGRLRNNLIDHRNDLMKAQIEIFDARQERSRLERRVSDLENQISATRSRSVVGRLAPRAFGPGGYAVSALNSIDTDIRIGRLEGEFATAKAGLARAEEHLTTVERNIREYESLIPQTEQELMRRGCNQ